MPTYLGMPSFPGGRPASAVGDTQLRANLRPRDAARSGPSGPARWPSCPTGRSCARRPRRSRTTRWPTWTPTCSGWRQPSPRPAAACTGRPDADEANAIVAGLVRAAGADGVVKVKSMATQETGLNEALAADGITALETDLAELIVQLGHDRPSHILVPAIHRNRAEIREIFLARDAGAPPGTDRRAGRAGRRRPGPPARARSCPPEVGVSGANFAIAETGTAGGGRVRGQRPDVPDAARDADLRRRASRRSCRPGATWRCSWRCCRARRRPSG